MATKRKRVVLTIETKSKIIKELEKGERVMTLARIHGVGTSTIIGIKKQKCNIENYMRNVNFSDASSSRKSLINPKNKNIDDLVFQWFKRQREKNIPISGPMLREKALELNKNSNGNPTFKASSGWLTRFKARHGIRGLDICGERLSADNNSAEIFKTTFKQLLIDEGYELANVYNADETGLIWKALPQKTLVCRREKSAPGRKATKDRITALLCTNVTGCHRLPIFIIGKSKNPRCLKHVNRNAMPIMYTNQKNAWMESNIFCEWFENIFIPAVKEHQSKHGHREKALLLIDNATCHSTCEILNGKDEFIKVKFFPSNVTSLIQPLDQGVIECFKRLYRKELLKRMLFTFECNTEEEVIEQYKKINLKHCFYMVADAWSNVKDITLKRAWRKLLPNTEIGEQERTIEEDIQECVSTLGRIPGCDNCDSNDVMEWLQCDEGNDDMSDENFTENEMNERNTDVPSHSEAFQAFEIGLRWLEVQEEGNCNELFMLNKLCNLAAKKIWDP